MNISQTFIERPIATSLLMAAIALFGGVAYRSLAVSDLPNVDFPTLLVTAALPGASPPSLLMAPTALSGGGAYRALAVSDLPNVDFPTLLVTAALPGASPETMAAAVATPDRKSTR